MNKMVLITKNEYHPILNDYRGNSNRSNNSISCCRSNRIRPNRKGGGQLWEYEC